MKADAFRALALALPGVEEGAHQDHPDFRVGGKVFATLGPRGDWGMVRLTPPGQDERSRRWPDVFEPFPGSWGRQGCTRVRLAKVTRAQARAALEEAWRARAPRRLLGQLDGGED